MMKIRTVLPLLLIALLGGPANAQLNDANSLYGVHWYGDTDPSASNAPTADDVEAMAPGREVWALEINHLDNLSPAGQRDIWMSPEWFSGFGAGGHNARVTGGGKGHSLIYRLQPNWGRNVPFFESVGSPNNDPFTLANFASAAAAAATTHANHARIWQVGNEINIAGTIENNRWNTGASAYNIAWEPTPAQYAATYLAVRDAIHTVTPNFAPPQQIVLMQPNSPGNASPGVRYMDGNEFLWRQIEAVPVGDRGKIDGFGLHAYAQPGGSNFGADGFMQDIREQLMIIDQFGLNDRPVFITEFNKHMPNATESAIGAQFAQASYQALHNWNTGTGGAWPGLANHNIAGAMWFVFHDTIGGGWLDYSLLRQKSSIASTNASVNPWYGFQAAAAQNYPSGSMAGGGGAIDHAAKWWEDAFASLDSAAPLPHWRVETTAAGSASASGGSVRLLGSGTDGGATLRTAGYVYGDFRAELDFTVTNANRATGSANTAESNFDFRIREGSLGYSLTFFTSVSDAARQNRVVLRRTNQWGQINTFNQVIGIATGDTFRVSVIARPAQLEYRIYKNGSGTPVVNWMVPDNAQRVGWVRMGTFNLAEARVDNFAIGGVDWIPSAAVDDWQLH